jgi:hypothetical protein
MRSIIYCLSISVHAFDYLLLVNLCTCVRLFTACQFVYMRSIIYCLSISVHAFDYLLLVNLCIYLLCSRCDRKATTR